MRVLHTLVLSLFLFSASVEMQAQVPVDIQLVEFASGFDRPVDLVNAGDERLFVVEKDGLIRILDLDGTTDPTPFLDMQSLTSTSGNSDERGLLGLAFHPDYEDNGYFFVNYTTTGSDTRVSRFTVSADPDVADFATREDIITIDQPASNHNGGCVRFGPDGYLYIGMGDGGSQGDPNNHAQNPNSLLGKMLRLDIDNGLPYTIPADNPFIYEAPMDEIYQIGFRNPWRFSFDSQTGDLWIGDVGQSSFEEIDFKAATEPGGQNYGWRCYEGNSGYNTTACEPISEYDAPAIAYAHGPAHCSVTGGLVYRGENNLDMQGKYFYSDYCSGQFWSLEPDDSGNWVNEPLVDSFNFGWSCFGEDVHHEIYAVHQQQGKVYRMIDEDCADFEATIDVILSTMELVAPDYTGATYQWYLDSEPIEGAVGMNYVAPGNGGYTVAITTTDGCYGLSETFVLIVDALEETESPWALTIFPNPASEILRVDIGAADEAVRRIALVDAKGAVVDDRRLTAPEGALIETIDLSDVPSGRYSLIIEGERTVISRPVSVVR